MIGDPRIIAALQQRAIQEQTGIQQYRINRSLFERLLYSRLVAYIDERIADEEKHYAMILSRLRDLDAVPAGGLDEVRVADEIRQIHINDLDSENSARENYRSDIQLCEEAGDYDTRDILVGILRDETDHARDLESQLIQIEQMTAQNYLSAQL